MKETDSKPMGLARLWLILPGAAVAAYGLVGFKMGYLWIWRENTPYGNGYAATLGYVWVGFLFVIIGLIPWHKLRGPKRNR